MKIQNPINLCDYRLLQARGMLQNRVPSKLPRIAVGLDLVSNPGKVAFLDTRNGSICSIRCITPWQSWRMETLQDGRLFSDTLECLKLKFAEMELGVITDIAFVVPYRFTCFQLNMLTQISNSIGIQVPVMDTAGIFSAFLRHAYDKKEDISCEMLCTLRETDFELSLIEAGDGVLESKGTDGIYCDKGWNSLTTQDFAKRIRTEVNQYFRDIAEKSGNAVKGNIAHVYVSGQSNQMIDDMLYEMTDRQPEKDECTAASGALLQLLFWRGITTMDPPARVTTMNRNIWVCLGDNGERALVLNRYMSIPTYRDKVKLLLSTQKQLRVYEGNFFNPDYDDLVAELPLEGFNLAEGKEIECAIDIDSRGNMTLNIYDHEHEKIIDHYRL